MRQGGRHCGQDFTDALCEYVERAARSHTQTAQRDQLGNLLASGNATLQAGLAHAHGGDYAIALAVVAGVIAVLVAAAAGLGVEARGVRFAGAAPKPAE
jgi:hypothetical protein